MPYPEFGERPSSEFSHPKNDNTSKVIYTNYQGEQIIKTAYPKISPWRDDVFKTLSNCLTQTKVPVKKMGLRLLINELVFLSESDIYLRLLYATTTERHKYHLHIHSESGLWSIGKTRTVSEIERLISLYRRHLKYL